MNGAANLLASRNRVVVGTRGSPLALAQTELVVNAISKSLEDREIWFETRAIKTVGDEAKKFKSSLSGKDAFTGQIDKALCSGEIDIAVHSLKDLPAESDSDDEIDIAAFPKRDSPFDALVSKMQNQKLEDIPKGAIIGTGSVRRSLQLKASRPDLKVKEISGNVHTRISKLRDPASGLDAIILAKAGLDRLGLTSEISEVLPRSIMLPAPGQGCLAVAVRKHDHFTRNIVGKIDDQDTRKLATCERSFSRFLGGGCNVPVAALATMIARRDSKRLRLEGLVQSEESRNMIARGSIIGDPSKAESIGKRLAEKLLELS